MITVTVVKGAFICVVVGSRISIRCNKKSCKGREIEDLDERNFPGTLGDPTQVRGALASQAQALQKAKGGKEEFGQVDTMLRTGDLNALKGQLVTPCAYDGRPSGYRRVICPYCFQAGVIMITNERASPGTVANIVIQEPMNQSGEEHARRRARITYVMLRSIDYLARVGEIKSTADVVCPGASVQMQKVKDEGYEDAHQVLREVTVGGRRLYDFRVSPLRQAMAYCLSVTSHLPRVWNTADGLIESEITVPMILLAQNCVNGTFRRQAGSDRAFHTLLWNELCAAYYLAVCYASGNAEGEVAEKLQTYVAVAKAYMWTLEPDFVQFNPVALWKSCLEQVTVN